MGEDLALVDERGGDNLRHHEAGREAGVSGEKGGEAFVDVGVEQAVDAALANAGEIGEHDGRVVKGVGQRRAVEVAARQHLCVGQVFGGIRGEYERIICRGAGFDFEDAFNVCQRAAHSAVDLRNAAQAVGILHAGVVFEVRLANLRLGKERAHVGRAGRLAGVRTRELDALVEGNWSAHESFKRHGAGEIGELSDADAARNGEAADGRHGLGAIEQREAFLGLKLQRRKAGAMQRLAARDAFAAIEGFAFADDDKCEMCERGQIAGCADGALLWNDGMDAGVEQIDEKLCDGGTRAAEAFGEHVGTQ